MQCQAKFLSTLSLRRATGLRFFFFDVSLFLSTLSLRRATEKVPADVYYQAFLSTLSLRRATISLIREPRELIDFYPRSPCGERLHHSGTFTIISHFYPRSPCGERLRPSLRGRITVPFLSTLSLRRATVRLVFQIP